MPYILDSYNGKEWCYFIHQCNISGVLRGYRLIISQPAASPTWQTHCFLWHCLFACGLTFWPLAPCFVFRPHFPVSLTAQDYSKHRCLAFRPHSWMILSFSVLPLLVLDTELKCFWVQSLIEDSCWDSGDRSNRGLSQGCLIAFHLPSSGFSDLLCAMSSQVSGCCQVWKRCVGAGSRTGSRQPQKGLPVFNPSWRNWFRVTLHGIGRSALLEGEGNLAGCGSGGRTPLETPQTG